MTPVGFRVGVSFHSFTEEYCALKWSMEDMMELAAQLGRGVEIVGPAHHRGFPDVTPEFVRSFHSGVERHGLIPVCYGSYADPFMRVDRDLSDDELVDYTLPQLRTAATLGFPTVRLQFFASRIIERILPLAERLCLKLGYELHAPLAFETDDTKRLIDQIHAIGHPSLGIIPDCGIFGRSIPKFRIADARARGIAPQIVQRALALWQEDAPLTASLSELTDMGLKTDDVGPIESFWGSICRSDPALLLEYMPLIVHVHGKYFSIHDGDEPDLRYRDVVAALVDGGYGGWMSSEYEGAAVGSSFDIVRAHQAMVHRYIDGAVAGR